MKTLICGLNWLGDSVMSLPGLELFQRVHPSAELTMLVKPGLSLFWSMHPFLDRILPLEEGIKGTCSTVRLVKQGHYSCAYILPHSLRSALIPFLARIPSRVGLPGPFRHSLLTEVVPPPSDHQQQHQAYEYMNLLAPGMEGSLKIESRLQPPPEAYENAQHLLQGADRPFVVLVPGAARGPSKQWPAHHFIALGKKLVAQGGLHVVALGTGAETPLCQGVVSSIGKPAMDLSGRTTLTDLASILREASAVVANDSGAMHLASAVGTPVVGLFGLTDPKKTGPLGSASRVIQKSKNGSRDIKRQSRQAEEALEAIDPGVVYEAVLDCLRRGTAVRPAP